MTGGVIMAAGEMVEEKQEKRMKAIGFDVFFFDLSTKNFASNSTSYTLKPPH